MNKQAVGIVVGAGVGGLVGAGLGDVLDVAHSAGAILAGLGGAVGAAVGAIVGNLVGRALREMFPEFWGDAYKAHRGAIYGAFVGLIGATFYKDANTLLSFGLYVGDVPLFWVYVGFMGLGGLIGALLLRFVTWTQPGQ